MSVKHLIALVGFCAFASPTTIWAHPSKIPHRHLEELEKPTRPKKVKKDRTTLTFSFGPSLNHTAPEPGDLPQDILDLGGGIDVAFNVRIDPYLGFRMNGMFSFHEGGDHTSVDGAFLSGITGDALLYIIPGPNRLEPYAFLGIGGFGLRGGGLFLPLQGVGTQGGLGLRVRLNPAVSLAVEGLLRLAYMDNSQERLPHEPFQSALLFLQSGSFKVVVDL